MDSSRSGREVWRPKDISNTNMHKLRTYINKTHNLSLANSEELHKYSVGDKTRDQFWVDIFIYLGFLSNKVPASTFFSTKQNTGVLPRLMYPRPIFFPGILMNFTENMLAGRDPNHIILHACAEGGVDMQHVTWGQLHGRVEKLADAMRSAGIQVGDRIAGIVSNTVETLVACLATLSIGAIWSTSSPDMGVPGILDRLLQIRPKLVFAESAVLYNGRVRDLMDKHMQWAKKLERTSEFQCVIVAPFRGAGIAETNTYITTWDEFLRKGTGRELVYAQLPFDHPGFIVYSSGTTGAPKCIVHSAAAVLLQVTKEYTFQIDVKPGDVLFQYTTTGWIMYALAICGIYHNGAIVLYDGSPLIPDYLTIFRLVAKLKVTCLGTSARFLSDLKTQGINPRDTMDLSSLRTVTSTGSVLTSEVNSWFYDKGFPKHIHLVSGSGGTDIACSLVSGDPTMPLHSGEIQTKALGMAVDVADTDAKQAISISSSGRAGELICRRPFPSQPVGFWGVDGEKKYRSSYFERFGDMIWYQGDFVQILLQTKGIIMLGRSDGVLNPSGIRFGSSEIYEVVDKIPNIIDSICVGQRRPQDLDERVILFVKLSQGHVLTPTLQDLIRAKVRTKRSARHVPRYIFAVKDIPYTINGKKIEIAVKQIVSGIAVKPSGAIANPESLKEYTKFVEIEKLEHHMRTKANL